MDRRQKKTRQAIFQALTTLLETKSYPNITVQEIIDLADVGRSTFYAHFETKDELLNALCVEIFDHVFAEHRDKEETHDFSDGAQSLEDELTHILYHLRDNRRYIRGILACESGELFMQYFRAQLRRVFAGKAAAQRSGIPADYRLNHMVCDFAETVRWWMAHEEYAPEEIGRFFTETTPL